MKNPWKKLGSKEVHKNPWFSVREDKVIRPNGKKGKYFVLTRKPSVYIVALNQKKQIAMVGQYRYTTGRYSLEVPAGGSDGQAPLTAAKRELLEETGFKAKNWKYLGSYEPANGLMAEVGHIFLATKLTNTQRNEQAEEGIMEMEFLSFKQVFKMFKLGQIIDAHTIVSVLKAAMELKIIK